MQLYPKKFEFTYSDRQIECELFPPHHLTKKRKISIALTKGNTLKIRAPKRTAHKDILTLLEKHGEWIVRHIQKQQSQQTHLRPLQYIQDETHLFMGKHYVLNIEETIFKKQNIELVENNLCISVRQNTPKKIFAFLDSWYRFKALEVFTDRIEQFKPFVSWIEWEKQPPLLRIKKMHSRWGSYISRSPGVITLNQHLIKAPLECIDYVIIHELCHAAEPNHSKRFYALVAKIMPDWKFRQTQLKQQGSLLLYNNATK